MTRKRKFKPGDQVVLIDEHRYYGGVYTHEALAGDIMTVLEPDMTGNEEYATPNGEIIPIYLCKNPSRPAYDSLRVDEDCIEAYVEVTDEDVLRLFGVKPMVDEAHDILHKHHLKDSGLECAGCSWRVSNRNGIRLKFADHLVDLLKKGNVLP